MKTPLTRPTRFLFALLACAAAFLLTAREGIAKSNTRYIRIDPVEHSGFDIDDLKKAFAAVSATLDKIADERFGPQSGNYQRLRRSVPVKVQVVDLSNHTPYEFEKVVLRGAQLQEIRDKKGSLWTRYTASDPTRLRWAKTDYKLMLLAHVGLDREASTEDDPRFYYQWRLSELFGDYKVVATGREPLRARDPATLRLSKP
ncbi:hypothetical protein AXK12_00500 [Cephaloticoccus capnophilus]|uniref:Uncharacterized protein n=1 Tax=Cephaloticoccus capnophilus TaxID=1548208 RepID=A0A139SIR1_9BACT|nr:hypothetical protein [Cephaloticoccus capnophilus]KXU34426.1 hypothetical protein AXK12_00500 [Cephaloticoccus capnophilus]